MRRKIPSKSLPCLAAALGAFGLLAAPTASAEPMEAQKTQTAVQTVPENRWTEAFEDILAYLYVLVRRTDASLIEEWELLVAGPEERMQATAPSRDPAEERRFGARE